MKEESALINIHNESSNTERKGLISIVIPIYNGMNYLDKTIFSIKSQSYEKIEVICVDDFSSDESLAYLKEISKTDNRFKIIEMPYKGGDASKVLSYAIQYCNGEFFFYMSQDDFLSNDCLEKCIFKIYSSKADICIPNLLFYYGKNSQKNTLLSITNIRNNVLTNEDAFFKCMNYEISGFALIRMTIINKVGTNDKYYDSCDTLTAKHFYFANKICYCDGTFFYRQNNNAITKIFSINNVYHLYSCNEMLEFAIQNTFSIRTLISIYKLILLKQQYCISCILKNDINFFDEAIKKFVYAKKKSSKILLTRKSIKLYTLYIRNKYFSKKNIAVSMLLVMIKYSFTKNCFYKRLCKILKNTN